MVYSTRRFVLCLTLCYFVLVSFSPFSIAITSLGEERANLGAFRAFVRFALVWFCLFPLPLGVWEGLRFVTVALPGLSSYLFFIAALSETRLAEERLLKEVGAGYTFFWTGRKKEEWREAGVGFAIKSHHVSKLSGLPKCNNDRLMTLRLHLSGKRHATSVSACAPTKTNPDVVKTSFMMIWIL